MLYLDRAETISDDSNEVLDETRDRLDAADDERSVRRRRELETVAEPSIRAGPPVRRLGIETIAIESTAALSGRERTPTRLRGAGVASTRSPWAGFRPATAVPPPPEPEPNPL